MATDVPISDIVPASEALQPEVLSTPERGVSTAVDTLSQGASGRNFNLDVLRGVAILLVVCHHLRIPGFVTGGWIGVDLFFVLSGFLISGLLFREWIDSGNFDIRRFYIRRGLKIYPAFYAMLATTLLVDKFIAPGISSFPVTRWSMLAELSFTQNYFSGIWGQTWSLAVEEHFYLLLPLLLWCMHKRNADRPFRMLPTMFLCVSAFELALRVFVGWKLSNVADEARYAFPTHLRIDGLFFGVALGYLYYFEPSKFREYARSKMGVVLPAAAALAATFIGLPSPIMHTFGYTCLLLGFGFLLCRVIDAKTHKLFVPLARLGFYSYSIYLWHGWACRLLPRTTVVEHLIAFIAAIAPGILAAHLLEYPVLAFRDRMYPSRSASLVRHAA